MVSLLQAAGIWQQMNNIRGSNIRLIVWVRPLLAGTGYVQLCILSSAEQEPTETICILCSDYLSSLAQKENKPMNYY